MHKILSLAFAIIILTPQAHAITGFYMCSSNTGGLLVDFTKKRAKIGGLSLDTSAPESRSYRHKNGADWVWSYSLNLENGYTLTGEALTRSSAQRRKEVEDLHKNVKNFQDKINHDRDKNYRFGTEGTVQLDYFPANITLTNPIGGKWFFDKCIYIFENSGT